VFENETGEYTLEQDITDAVIQRFVADNHLKVVDERVAQSVIKGKLTGYRTRCSGSRRAATRAPRNTESRSRCRCRSRTW